MLNLKTIYGDGTHQKASANKNKYKDDEVEIEAKSYDEELLKEINEEREKLGKKAYTGIEKVEKEFDEKTGEEIEVKQTKHIKVSKTDPESGYYHKGEHEKCFAYTHQAFSDGNGKIKKRQSDNSFKKYHFVNNLKWLDLIIFFTFYNNI